MNNDVTRRTFLGAISASAAGVLTGGLSKLVAAIPEARDSTFRHCLEMAGCFPRRIYFCTLPVAVFGSSGTKRIFCGHLKCAR